MHRRGWDDHRRARYRTGQASLYGPPLLRRDARGDVRAPRRVRSRAPIESRQGGAGAQLPRMARRAIGSPALGVSDVGALTSTDAVAARVREARATGSPLRIVGRGHWLDAGRPCATI